ncbi:hypothetical protein SELMODRAFT_431673 [Selaginella moellendorffii]|uniref:non-specific serine/threonine protein kinase n=1 Tax=Selaginella moellendorffii TaxID=88036 RepID=D8TDE6_SELML|nr:hypothetical protein SELMODRAFT_431673 [Selaginella moellendorffii]
MELAEQACILDVNIRLLQAPILSITFLGTIQAIPTTHHFVFATFQKWKGFGVDLEGVPPRLGPGMPASSQKPLPGPNLHPLIRHHYNYEDYFGYHSGSKLWLHDHARFTVDSQLFHSKKYRFLLAISSGASHACAIRSYDNRADCWGSINSSTVPNQDFVSISSGSGFSCGLTLDGATACWGEVPGAIPKPANDKKFMALFAGAYVVCGITAQAGETLCWGAMGILVYLKCGAAKFGKINDSGHGVVCLSASELQAATNNYCDDSILGKGSFATVYKGVLHNGRQVAIKQAKASTRLAVPLEPEPLYRAVKLALECTKASGKERPSMSHVAKTLEEVLEAVVLDIYLYVSFSPLHTFGEKKVADFE